MDNGFVGGAGELQVGSMELPKERRAFRRIMETMQPLDCVSLRKMENLREIEDEGDLQASYGDHESYSDFLLHTHI